MPGAYSEHDSEMQFETKKGYHVILLTHVSHKGKQNQTKTKPNKKKKRKEGLESGVGGEWRNIY